MDDYIKRSDILGTTRLLDTDIVRQDKVASWLLDQILYDIEHTPAADVVHVIRCKDCRYSDDFPFSKKETIYCNMHDVTMCENDFCSRGNSKDEEKEGNG